MVYVSPVPHLASIVFEKWQHLFGERTLDKIVVELTGEVAADVRLLAGAHIVVATTH